MVNGKKENMQSIAEIKILVAQAAQCKTVEAMMCE